MHLYFYNHFDVILSLFFIHNLIKLCNYNLENKLKFVKQVC